MAIFKRPGLSREDLSLSFGAIAFPVHVWAIINILIILPAWLLRLTVWELAGGISYPLAAALLESLFFWIVLVLAGMLLPRKWLADKFVALSSALVWLLSAWAVLLQYIIGRILNWGPGQVILGLLLILLSFGLAYWAVRRFERVEGWIQRLAQGLAVVTYVYMLFDLLGVAVILIRNL